MQTSGSGCGLYSYGRLMVSLVLIFTIMSGAFRFYSLKLWWQYDQNVAKIVRAMNRAGTLLCFDNEDLVEREGIIGHIL